MIETWNLVPFAREYIWIVFHDPEGGLLRKTGISAYFCDCSGHILCHILGQRLQIKFMLQKSCDIILPFFKNENKWGKWEFYFNTVMQIGSTLCFIYSIDVFFFSWNRYHFPIDHQKTKKTPGLGAAAVRLLHNTFPLPPLPAPKKGLPCKYCSYLQPSSNPYKGTAATKVCRWWGITDDMLSAV